MNKTRAVARLKRIIGKNFAYREDPKAPTFEEREALRAAHQAAIRDRDRLAAARDARKAELLRDPHYQLLCTQAKEAGDVADSLRSKLLSRRITVGRNVGGLFFSITVQADNWEEAVAIAVDKQIKGEA